MVSAPTPEQAQKAQPFQLKNGSESRESFLLFVVSGLFLSSGQSGCLSQSGEGNCKLKGA